MVWRFGGGLEVWRSYLGGLEVWGWIAWRSYLGGLEVWGWFGGLEVLPWWFGGFGVDCLEVLPRWFGGLGVVWRFGGLTLVVWRFGGGLLGGLTLVVCLEAWWDTPLVLTRIPGIRRLPQETGGPRLGGPCPD